MEEIEVIKKEYQEILEKLKKSESISDWSKLEELSKRKFFLEKIIAKEKELKEIKNEIEENKGILAAKEDSELVSLAETEIIQLEERQKILEKELKDLLKKGEEESQYPLETPEVSATSGQAVIVEIRAGTGGEEAALFAKDLFRMYSKYASFQGWQQKILDSRVSEIGGFKEIIFQLKPASPAKRGENGGVFSKMKYEAGVHRVQRIPITEKTGRIHTSTVSVAVLPKPKKAEIKINPQDLKIDFYRASGPGGQYVNRRETAVRITHRPSGIVVTSQTERNQLQNRQNAMAILEAKLLELKKRGEEEEISKKRKAQIGWAKRAEKIRTYNFLQDRITDHRIQKSWKRLKEILDGKLDLIIKALKTS